MFIVQRVATSVKKIVDKVEATLVSSITLLKCDWDTTVDGLPPELFLLHQVSQMAESPPSKSPFLVSHPRSKPPFFFWHTPARQRDQRTK